MKPRSAISVARDGPGRPRGVPEPLIWVGDDFEVEYPGASALATECYVRSLRALVRSSPSPYPVTGVHGVNPASTTRSGL